MNQPYFFFKLIFGLQYTTVRTSGDNSGYSKTQNKHIYATKTPICCQYISASKIVYYIKYYQQPWFQNHEFSLHEFPDIICLWENKINQNA